ncbi:MAG: hypothetical protein HY255_05655 [Betaproteobacteria bacterium]|nr:hypothetical protein [Betaproteobacteria bacterium]
MKPILSIACGAMLLFAMAAAHAQVAYVDTRDLTPKQEAGVKRFLAAQDFAATLDMASMVAYQARYGQGRWEVWVSVSATSLLSAQGVCRSQRYRFSADAGAETWKTMQKDEWTMAWSARNRTCAPGGAEIRLGDAVADRDFLAIERNQKIILDKSTSLIGGNTLCSEILHCGLRLSGVYRIRDDASRKGQFSLTLVPVKDSSCADSVQAQVTYEGPATDLWPKDVSCPAAAAVAAGIP